MAVWRILLITILTIVSAIEFATDENDQLIIISNSSARAYLTTAEEFQLDGVKDSHRVVLQVGMDYKQGMALSQELVVLARVSLRLP